MADTKGIAAAKTMLIAQLIKHRKHELSRKIAILTFEFNNRILYLEDQQIIRHTENQILQLQNEYNALASEVKILI